MKYDMLRSLIAIEVNKAVQEFLFHNPATPDCKRMTPADEANLTDIITGFVAVAIPKYIKGKAEHGGNIAVASPGELKQNLQDELIDAIVYLHNIKV